MWDLTKSFTKNKKLFLGGAALILLLFLGIFALNILDKNSNDLDDGMLTDAERANLLLQTGAALEDALKYLNNIDGVNLIGEIKNLHDFIIALQKDIARGWNKNPLMVFLQSHTLQQLGNFGLGKLPGIVDFLKKIGKLPSSFKLPATFGAEDFVTGLARHIGSGKADVDTITSYLDGMNKACWAVVGYLVGGAEGARLFQTLADTAVKLLRDATFPLFKEGVLLWRKQWKKLVQNWQKRQEQRIKKGQVVQPITEVYSEKTLKKSGIEDRLIKKLNDLAHKQNQMLIGMKKSLSVERVRTYSKQGRVRLGGVEISPVVVKSGKGGSGIREDIIDTRPTKDSLTWPVKKDTKDKVNKKEGDES